MLVLQPIFPHFSFSSAFSSIRRPSVSTSHRNNTNHYHTDITTPSVSHIITPALSPRHHRTDLSRCARCRFGPRSGCTHPITNTQTSTCHHHHTQMSSPHGNHTDIATPSLSHRHQHTIINSHTHTSTHHDYHRDVNTTSLMSRTRLYPASLL